METDLLVQVYADLFGVDIKNWCELLLQQPNEDARNGHDR